MQPMKKDEEDQIAPNIEEPTNAKSGAKVRPPNWLGEDERAKWLLYPEWRSTYQSEKSRVTKQFLFYTLRTIGIAIGASLIITFFIWWTKSQNYFDLSTLISIGNISCATAAAVISIILFFVVFFFGRAGELEDQARNSIRHEIASLELSADQLSEFAWADVQESVTDSSIKAKAKHLIDTSNKFRNGIRELIGIFSRATRGTFYDNGKLYLLDRHISAKGGDWYVAYRSLITAPKDRDFALKVWRNVGTASSNIMKLNDDIQLAQDQYHKALQVSFALPSLLIAVVLALAAIFMANVLPAGFSITLLSIILISLLTAQMLLLVRWAYLLIYGEVVVRRANREADRKYSEKVTRVDEREMVQDTISFYESIIASTGEKKQENNKPNGTKAGNS
jgi:hypothetical protein